MLLVVGLLAVYSASFAIGELEYGDTNYFIIRQAGAAVLGLALLWFFMRLDYHFLRTASLLMMFLALVGLLAVLVPGVGLERNGAHRWLSLGPLPPLQPSEFAKLAIIVYIAAWLASRRDNIKHFSMGFVPFTLMVGLIASLVLLEPDMGTTIIIVLTTCTLFFVAGAPLSHLTLLMLGGGLISWALMTVTGHQPAFWAEQDPGTFNLRMDLVNALDSGGAFGLGWGASRQHFVAPGLHDTAIFASIGKELGFAGIASTTLLFFLFVYRSLRVAVNATDRFGAYLAVGMLSWVAYQALINVGGVTYSTPMVTIALPFLSYGGSALVATLAAAGILLSISSRRAPTQAERSVPGKGSPLARPLLG